MKTVWNTVQFSFAAVGGFLGWFLGGCDGLLYALIAFVTVDYVTGVMCAVVDRKLSSSVGFKGIFRKERARRSERSSSWSAFHISWTPRSLVTAPFCGQPLFSFISPMRGYPFWRMQVIWGSLCLSQSRPC